MRPASGPCRPVNHEGAGQVSKPNNAGYNTRHQALDDEDWYEFANEICVVVSRMQFVANAGFVYSC